jgi:hypothetical protein
MDRSKDMDDVSAGVLSDLTAFLPLWVKRLQRFRPSKDEWETERERWLREAVFRADGVGGLERIARRRSGLRRASPGMRRSPIRVTGRPRSKGNRQMQTMRQQRLSCRRRLVRDVRRGDRRDSFSDILENRNEAQHAPSARP